MGVAVQRWQCQRAGWGCGTSCGISASGSSGDGGWLCTYGTGATRLGRRGTDRRTPRRSGGPTTSQCCGSRWRSNGLRWKPSNAPLPAWGMRPPWTRARSC
ncbi:hypothetical protein CHLRE_03g157326v5 [Chlamydomonas reinhardtii]|uniref:Uncharacterized protein n=1 Tax=Chlamydomonas reinhardtii TaxID=3055 RepID=A0A2K3DW40_CHLRE|nr:uncharacterized protein CHLRE_03g157326v5 [Chlamydomonas reinhardtii]PNW84751.1 hypothetical protein CHLRE_03g157326v5 [Chlamydomonas reinhardtii]